MTLSPDRPVPDSLPKSWVDRAPEFARPYLRLARYDRPVGFWLLAIPCWMGLAAARLETGLGWDDLRLALLFAIGAVAMRGAGCTWNDMIDRDLDARVARTADRPLAAGTITLRQAQYFLAGQLLVGFIVLVMLPWPAIWTALAALALVAAYPFMKRITWWPQAWLGLTFNWGVLVAGAAADAVFSPAILFLYAAAVIWTLGYDTIYACQDQEDDALAGVKSSALRLGSAVKPFVLTCYIASAALALAAGLAGGAGLGFALGFALYAAHLFHIAQSFDPGKPDDCLARFKMSVHTGLLLTAAFLLGGI
ncbi:4-hydroxybenzoate octaprenyltransferase [Alkalicaulis satelles]|uniref:4-hydroxybenzoate octaprenyltransferase n=1 Tax=Alkalicaulis satelles TaxID=2609175 RepID=A0A5M6Z8Q8_9PROT|nr:4-hydroxybenzoate octaprenyltransferase [Alkalicaulis satelles]KAA5801032.1 4-hydroxybenzoate octaprenyltransferase [Alkalicaulis satelles]